MTLSLEDALGFNPADPAHQRALALVDADRDLLLQLKSLRERAGLSQADVALRMGVTQPAISSFERQESDPKLSTIRRYAQAVEALIGHVVAPDEGQLKHGSKWFTASTVFTVNSGRPAEGMVVSANSITASLTLAA